MCPVVNNSPTALEIFDIYDNNQKVGRDLTKFNIQNINKLLGRKSFHFIF